MSENLPANVQFNSNPNGTVTFATDVVSTIAGLAANEVEGVASMYGGNSGFADVLSRKKQATKNITKGVKVELVDGKLNVMVSIFVDYGTPVPEVAKNIQENVKKAIETMAGLSMGNIDVHVQGISFDKEQRAVAEIEEHQRILLQKQHDTTAIGGERAPDSVREQVHPQPAPDEDEDDDADFELDLEDVEDEDEFAPEADEPDDEGEAEEQ